MTFDQIAILLTGIPSIWLTQGEKPSRWACIIGLAGQPFWLYSTFKAGQWGSFVSSVGFTVVWARGIKTHWLRKA